MRRAFKNRKKKEAKTPILKMRRRSIRELKLSVNSPALYKTFEEQEDKRSFRAFRRKVNKEITKYEKFLNTNKEANKIMQEIDVHNKFWEGIKNPKFFETNEDYKKLIGSNLPWIYVFVMDIIDGYVKIGYTLAKTPNERVDEWSNVYKGAKLHLIAKFPASFVCDGIRLCIDDTDVHNFVIKAEHLRAERTIFEGKGRYCKEFFKNQNVDGSEELFNFDLNDNDSWEKLFSYDNIDEHVKIDIFGDIMETIYGILGDSSKTFSEKKAELPHLKKYGDLLTGNSEEAKILRWSFTDEQIDIIKKGVESLGIGNTELLLAAIMRFGKSAVSYQIMLKYFKPSEFHGGCHMIVSGKDTRETWQKDFFHEDIVEKTKDEYDKGTVFMWYEGQTIHMCGNIKDEYGYREVYNLSGPKTKPQYEITKDVFDEICKNNIVFFYVSFQDIYGEKEEGETVYKIKKKHEIIFDTTFDSIIIDETHFGARSRVFGAILEGEDKITVDDGDVKPIKCKAHLHLSATPYKILASNEFNSEKHDIIGIITLADIYRFKEKWAKENEGKPEWENPYFGTPQLHPLLLNIPNEVLDNITVNGDSFFAELFSSKNGGDETKLSLKHKEEVVAVFSYLFGSIEAKRAGLVRNNTVTENGVMKHLVMVLPSRKACEMVYNLLNSGCIAGMGEYKVYMLSGITASKLIDGENELNRILWDSEKAGHKTITLTCDKCTTGSTINLWDTMLYFRDGDSAEFYDQTWGRILSRAVIDVLDENNKATGEKVCIKNHVYFIDFKPNRAVEVRYDYVTQMMDYFLSLGTEEGKEQAERVQNEIKYYPMCRIDDFTEINDFDSLTREHHKTFIETDSRGENYQNNKLCNILMPLNILKLCGISVFSESKLLGVEIKTRRGEGHENGNPIICEYPGGGNGETEEQNEHGKLANKKSKEEKKERATMLKIINMISNLSIVCTKRVTTSKELLDAITGEKAVVYKGLNHFSDICKVLEASCTKNEFFTAEARTNLNNFINEKNLLVNDSKNYSKVERAQSLISSLRNLTSSEVVTPSKASKVLLHMIHDKIDVTSGNILDFCTYGELILEMYMDDAYGPEFTKEHGYVLPGSKEATIFVEKLFDILDLDKNHILYGFDTYNWTYEYTKKLKTMKFNAIVGNPPYQGESKNGGPAPALYPKFFMSAIEASGIVSLITPARFFAGGLGTDGMRKFFKESGKIQLINYYDNGKDIFGQNSTGSICLFLYNEGYNGECIVNNISGDSLLSSEKRSLNEFEVIIGDNQLRDFIKRNHVQKDESMYSMATTTGPFGLTTAFKGHGVKESDDDILVHIANGGVTYASKEEIKKGLDLLPGYKVIISRNISEHAGETDKNGKRNILTKAIKVIAPNEAFTQSYFCVYNGPSTTKEEAERIMKYLKSMRARAFILPTLSGVNINKDSLIFVPKIDFSDSSEIDWKQDIDKQLAAKDDGDIVQKYIKPMK